MSLTGSEVSVICVSYNHRSWVEEALLSVIHQSYGSKKIICVDNGSTDGTSEIIKKLSTCYTEIKCIYLKEAVPYPVAFNLGLKQCKGEFIIDFSTDDIMLPQRLEQQVLKLGQSPSDTAAIFSNAACIDVRGRLLYYHHDALPSPGRWPVWQGWVFEYLLSNYFISSPTLMVRRQVLDEMGGYDEDYSFEDFNMLLWLSRRYRLEYLNTVTTLVRKRKNSLSSGWYQKNDPKLMDTLRILEKYGNDLRTAGEQAAWRKRVIWETRQAVFSGNHREAKKGLAMLKSSGVKIWQVYLLQMLVRLPLPFRRLWKLKQQWYR